jgi:enoyl-CoA hydratase/carnithine racemase
MPQFKAFRAQVDAGVLTVTLDDPPLNLIGPTFAEDLIALIQEAEANPAYRVVVFESAVANFFSAHVDLARVPQLLDSCSSSCRALSPSRRWRAVFVARATSSFWRAICASLPTSALSSAKWKPGSACFRAPEACNTLHGVGRQRAMEVVLSGDDYGAELAAQYGWINRAIADATLDTFVGDLARRIAKFPASGLRAIKTSIANISLPDEHAIRADGAKFLELMNTEEAKSRRAARDERYREDARRRFDIGLCQSRYLNYPDRCRNRRV